MNISYSCGNEELFLSFIKSIKQNDKVALISHIDLDGFTSAKVISQIVTPAIIKFVHYDEINDSLLQNLKELKINKVILTDLGMDSCDFIKKLEEFSQVLMIDHHEFKEDYNSKNTSFINAKGYCAAFLCFNLASKIKNIEKIEWLVALASVSDVCFMKNLDFVKQVYLKNSDNFNEKDYQKGMMWDILVMLSQSIIYFQKNLIEFYKILPESINELNNLQSYSLIVQKDIKKNYSGYLKEREKIPGGWFFEVKSEYNIESFLATKISLVYPNETVVLSHKKENLYKISARNHNGTVNMITMLKTATEGFKLKDSGGHIPAAGASVSLEDYEEFKKRIKEISLDKIKTQV